MLSLLHIFFWCFSERSWRSTFKTVLVPWRQALDKCSYRNKTEWSGYDLKMCLGKYLRNGALIGYDIIKENLVSAAHDSQHFLVYQL